MRFTLVLLLPVVVSSALRGNGKPTLSDTGDLEGNLLPPRFRFPVPCPGPYDITDTRLIIECQGDPNTFVLESVQGFYCCPWSKPSPSTQTQTQTKEQQPVRQWNPVKNDIRGQGLDDRLGYGLDNGNGMALSGDGTTIAAASRYNDGTYHDGGQVRIWQDTPFGWEPVGQELQGDHGGSHFGWSVDINHDGTVVAIGSIRHIGQKGNYQGMLRVYSLVDGFPMGKWQPLGEDLEGDDLLDYFGFSTSLSRDGKTVAVGAIQHMGAEGKQYNGYVKVFSFLNGAWTMLGNKIYGERDGGKFGNSLSISSNGRVLAIGASHHTGSSEEQGMVKIYQLRDDWEQVGTSIEGEPTSKSGTSISLSGDGMTVAIGSPSHHQERGHSRVFRYREGHWRKVGQDVTGESEEDGAGVSVSLSGDGAILVLGTHQPHKTGHVQVMGYDYNTDRWLLVGNMIAGHGLSEHFGSSVSVSKDGTRVAISAPFARNGEYTQAGVVTIYDVKEGNGSTNAIHLQQQ